MICQVTLVKKSKKLLRRDARSLAGDLTGRNSIFNRRADAGEHMELFFVAAVASVLAIRLFLELTGYPQIGGGGLHIAHMLWGGLLMLLALAVLLSFIVGRAGERLAALIGGVGFGTFIDEIGKFVTSDNDYFFRPAVALIYMLFVLLFFLMRALQTGGGLTEQEYLLNALRLIEEVVVRDLDAEERVRAREYVRRGGAGGEIARALDLILDSAEPSAGRREYLLDKAKRIIAGVYRSVARRWWFPVGVILFFLGQLGLRLLYAFVLVFIVGLGRDEILDVGIAHRIVERFRRLSFVDWIEIGSSLLSGALVLWGVVRIKRSRVLAFEWFARSLLVTILVTQPFAFYKEQFSALFGLLLNVALLVALRFCVEQERATEEAKKG